MKLFVALVVALIATISVSMALDASVPAWLEKMGPGETYTHGETAIETAAVADGTFVPQSLNSKLTFVGTGGVSASIDQTVGTALSGTPVGINRQLLQQDAAAYVYTKKGLAIDAENDASATTLVMNIVKDQNALFSGKVVSTPSEVLVNGIDAPFDKQAGADDPYGGGHNLVWLALTHSPADFTTTYNDDATLTANSETGTVSLRESVKDATVTVSANANAPSGFSVPNEFEIKDGGCVGNGETWTLNSDGTGIDLGRIGDLAPSAVAGSAQLTEAASSISSDVTLQDQQVMIKGNVMNFRTIDGTAGLNGAFANAITSPHSTMDVNLDGNMDFWWE